MIIHKRQVFPKTIHPIPLPYGDRERVRGIKDIDSCANEHEKSGFLEKLNWYKYIGKNFLRIKINKNYN